MSVMTTPSTWSLSGRVPTSFEIEADASSGGRISPSGTSTVTRGNNKTYTMTPNSGYGILAVYVDGDYVGDSRTYTFRDVDEDHEIFVRFAKKAEIHDDYDIDITWSDGGSISPSGRGTVSVEKGDDRTFTFVPESGYKVAVSTWMTTWFLRPEAIPSRM